MSNNSRNTTINQTVTNTTNNNGQVQPHMEQQNTSDMPQTMQQSAPETLQMPQNTTSMPPASMHEQMIISPQFRNTIDATGTNQQEMTSQPNAMMSVGAQQIPFSYEQFPSLNGFIRTQIGRRVRAEFLMGSSQMNIRDGYLVGVGSNYLVINEIGTKTITVGDFYSLKFISFLY